jgi:hypothetical protein
VEEIARQGIELEAIMEASKNIPKKRSRNVAVSGALNPVA